MQNEWLKETLSKVGLTPAEIEVYTLLAFGEPKTAKQISQSLTITKQRVYQKVNHLRRKGYIKVISGQGQRYCAEPIDQILKLYADIKIKEAQNLSERKEDIMKNWDSNTS